MGVLLQHLTAKAPKKLETLKIKEEDRRGTALPSQRVRQG
jgi:hypothetical protein